jgi:hypothetical protein
MVLKPLETLGLACDPMLRAALAELGWDGNDFSACAAADMANARVTLGKMVARCRAILEEVR